MKGCCSPGLPTTVVLQFCSACVEATPRVSHSARASWARGRGGSPWLSTEFCARLTCVLLTGQNFCQANCICILLSCMWKPLSRFKKQSLLGYIWSSTSKEISLLCKATSSLEVFKSRVNVVEQEPALGGPWAAGPQRSLPTSTRLNQPVTPCHKSWLFFLISSFPSCFSVVKAIVCCFPALVEDCLLLSSSSCGKSSLPFYLLVCYGCTSFPVLHLLSSRAVPFCHAYMVWLGSACLQLHFSRKHEFSCLRSAPISLLREQSGLLVPVHRRTSLYWESSTSH